MADNLKALEENKNVIKFAEAENPSKWEKARETAKNGVLGALKSVIAQAGGNPESLDLNQWKALVEDLQEKMPEDIAGNREAIMTWLNEKWDDLDLSDFMPNVPKSVLVPVFVTLLMVGGVVMPNSDVNPLGVESAYAGEVAKTNVSAVKTQCFQKLYEKYPNIDIPKDILEQDNKKLRKTAQKLFPKRNQLIKKVRFLGAVRDYKVNIESARLDESIAEHDKSIAKNIKAGNEALARTDELNNRLVDLLTKTETE